MSWPNRPRAALVAALATLGLAGCGFSPLYGTHSVNPEVDSELASVSVQPIEDRMGQELYNALNQTLDAAAPGTPKRYTLSVLLRATTSQQALRHDETATRAKMQITATYQLAQQGKLQVDGQAAAQVTYNMVDAHFATVVGERDATARGTAELAESIKRQLAVYFERRRATRP